MFIDSHGKVPTNKIIYAVEFIFNIVFQDHIKVIYKYHNEENKYEVQNPQRESQKYTLPLNTYMPTPFNI